MCLMCPLQFHQFHPFHRFQVKLDSSWVWWPNCCSNYDDFKRSTRLGSAPKTKPIFVASGKRHGWRDDPRVAEDPILNPYRVRTLMLQMKMEDVATWEGCFGRCFVKFALQKCKRNLRWSVSSFNIGSFLRIQHLEQRARWFLPDTDQIPCRSSVSQLSGLQKCIHVVKSSMRPMRWVGHAVDFATLKTSWWFFGWKQVPAKLCIFPFTAFYQHKMDQHWQENHPAAESAVLMVERTCT